MKEVNPKLLSKIEGGMMSDFLRDWADFVVGACTAGYYGYGANGVESNYYSAPKNK